MKFAELYDELCAAKAAVEAGDEAKIERDRLNIREDLASMGMTEEDGWVLQESAGSFWLSHPPQLPFGLELRVKLTRDPPGGAYIVGKTAAIVSDDFGYTENFLTDPVLVLEWLVDTNGGVLHG